MPYSKTTWVNDTAPAINATNLNKIEDGIFTSIAQDGSTSMSGQFVTITGSVTTPSIAPRQDSNTGIFFPTADTIAFVEGGVEALRIDSSANIGIGTQAPSQKLEVVGAISATSLTIGGTSVLASIKGQTTVGTSSFTTTTIAPFTRRADVTISGITSNDFAIVSFPTSSYNTASIAGITLAECYSNGIRLYATSTPSSTLTFDYLVIKG